MSGCCDRDTHFRSTGPAGSGCPPGCGAAAPKRTPRARRNRAPPARLSPPARRGCAAWIPRSGAAGEAGWRRGRGRGARWLGPRGAAAQNPRRPAPCQRLRPPRRAQKATRRGGGRLRGRGGRPGARGKPPPPPPSGYQSTPRPHTSPPGWRRAAANRGRRMQKNRGPTTRARRRRSPSLAATEARASRLGRAARAAARGGRR